MKAILVHVSSAPGMEARLQAALDLGRSFNAHIRFLQQISQTVALPGDFNGTLAAAMLPVLQDQANTQRAQIEARLADEDVCWDWVQEIGMADARLVSHAALNDVVLVGAGYPAGGDRLAGQLAIEGRTPVLVVPGNAAGFDAAKPVVIGWNGSPEAARAIKGAMPLLASASAVHLVTIVGENEARHFDLPPTEGAEFLSRHGISSEILTLPAQGRHPAELMMEAAQRANASCVVMGAYGHSRMFEMVFGGVTRKILQDPPLPVLMAH